MYLSQIHYSWNCLYKCLLFSVLQWFWPLLHQGNKKKKQQLARAVSISLPKTVSKREHRVQAFLFIFNISKQIWTFAYSLWLCLDVVLLKQQRRSSRKGPETNWISTCISHNPPAHANAPVALETYSNLNFFFVPPRVVLRPRESCSMLLHR